MQLRCLIYDQYFAEYTVQKFDFIQLDAALQLTFASAYKYGLMSCQNHMPMLHNKTWLQALNIVTMFCFLLKLFQLNKEK